MLNDLSVGEGGSQVSKCWSRNLDVWVIAGSILSVHSPPPNNGNFAQCGAELGQEGLEWVSSVV